MASFDWRTVESEEYPNYIANLRAVGCPEETIRDIIIADVNKLFEDRKKSLFGARSNRLEYWKPWAQRKAPAFDEERIKAQQDLAREKRAVIKTLLGVELEEKPDLMTLSPLEEQLDFLSQAKRTAVIEVEQQYAARQLKLTMSGVDMNELEKLEKERDAEIATLLSPEELADYRLRRSNTASRMTWELATFEPTEPEFREIFKLRSQVEDEFGLTRNGDLGSAATAKLEGGLKSLLGNSRYMDYELSQNYVFKKIYELANRNGFGKDAATYVFNLKKESENQTKAVRMDAALTPEQRAASLLSIRRTTELAVRTIFDGEAFQTFHIRTGFWLNDISPESQ